MNYWTQSDQLAGLSFSFSYSSSCPSTDDSHWTVKTDDTSGIFSQKPNADAGTDYGAGIIYINTEKLTNGDDHLVTMGHETGHNLGFAEVADACQGSSIMTQHNYHIPDFKMLCPDYNASAQNSGSVGQVNGGGYTDYVPDGDCDDMYDVEYDVCYNSEVAWICGVAVTFVGVSCDPPED